MSFDQDRADYPMAPGEVNASVGYGADGAGGITAAGGPPGGAGGSAHVTPRKRIRRMPVMRPFYDWYHGRSRTRDGTGTERGRGLLAFACYTAPVQRAQDS